MTQPMSPELSQAYDILREAGIYDQDRLTLCVVTERNGKDPVGLARKLVRYYRVLNEIDR